MLEDGKAFGPGDFNLAFLMNCWVLVKNDLLKLFDDFHGNGKASMVIGSLFIVLIPKTSAATKIKTFCQLASLRVCTKSFLVLSTCLKRSFTKLLKKTVVPLLSEGKFMMGTSA